ncbi:KUP/HAK/KT family potassium transporter [Nocardioides sp. Iso805N]|uniref:KUP/HAK/KT family potassium transporter n=1 Tax=Nocardioides sp. Iso805N TaxID=1283287 RepID=UPI0003671890|nr:KUP/HAK/KT family potassium transporter [Nocardioides sp. Iso805N]
MATPAGASLTVGALGVVFGDIGTSPLYAMRAVLGEGKQLDQATVYGLTSTVIWSLLLVVTALYVGLLLRTDNEGEGGLLALLALLRRTATSHRTVTVTVFLGMIGAAMFLGDSVITPAISVLSAAEGLKVADPGLAPLVVPVALVILAGVFVLQHIGTGAIGRLYGPVMVLWFVVLALAGIGSLVHDPPVLAAISPSYAVAYFFEEPATAFIALGSVILAVTGAEALYADLGHFGRSPIRRAWLFLVLPALILAYLGEAGEVMRHPAAAMDPFYAVVPSLGTIPVLIIATAATIIASEAVIAGGFTVVHQGGGLGILPSLRTRHTSSAHAGQIYIPAANWALGVAVLAVVIGFRSSERLAAAYGLAVSVTLLVTVTLYVVLQHARRNWRKTSAGAAAWVLMLTFFVAALPKVVSGGWLPLLIGSVMFVVMWTWWTGQRRVATTRREEELPLEDLVARLVEIGPERVPGDGVFLTYDRAVAPFALRTALDLGRVLPERTVLLSWHVEDTPTSRAHEHAIRVEEAGEGIVSLDVTLGYRDRLNVVDVLRNACRDDERLDGLDPDSAYFFLSEPKPRVTRDSPMPVWQQRLYLLLSRLVTDRVDQLAVPRDRAVTLGRELRL